MARGVNYANAEDFNLWLGTGTDGLYIDSTHAGTTDVFMGDGNATVNQRDDTIAISSIGGVTTIHGQGGNDFFYVNVEARPTTGLLAQFKSRPPPRPTTTRSMPSSTAPMRTASARCSTCTAKGTPTSTHVNLAGQGDALVNVLDNGAPDNGVDTLVINGADVVSGLANNPNDTFLLRRDFVALLNGIRRRIRHSTRSSASTTTKTSTPA